MISRSVALVTSPATAFLLVVLLAVLSWNVPPGGAAGNSIATPDTGGFGIDTSLALVEATGGDAPISSVDVTVESTGSTGIIFRVTALIPQGEEPDPLGSVVASAIISGATFEFAFHGSLCDPPHPPTGPTTSVTITCEGGSLDWHGGTFQQSYVITRIEPGVINFDVLINGFPGHASAVEGPSVPPDGDGDGDADGPFTPTYTQTFDDAAPDDPFVVPASDTCEVGVPCKSLFHLSIPDGQPGNRSYPGIGSPVIQPVSYESVFGDAAVPDGAIVGGAWGQFRAGLMGSCESGDIFPYEEFVYEGTTVHATTTGAPSDLASFYHWPVQLDSVVDSVAISHPGASLKLRWVLPGSPFNILIFDLVGGETLFLSVGGDPATSPESQNCGPIDSYFLTLGLSRDNPDTAADEGGVPLKTCVAPGTSSFELTLDRNDTPPGDITTLFDTTTCTPNTQTGTSVQVPLLGGSSTTGGVDVTFDEVVSEGSTSVTGSSSGPPPPTGFQVIGIGAESTYYDINTTAEYTGPATLCINYDDSGLSAEEESALQLMQYDGSTFVDRTTSVDTVANIICASAPSFSTWAVMTEPPTPAGEELVWGDHNCSGSADPVDSLLTLRFDAGLSTNTGDCPDFGQVVDVQNASSHPWGDVDCGGDVTPVDSLKLLRFDAGLSVTQAAGCPQIGSEVLVSS